MTRSAQQGRGTDMSAERALAAIYGEEYPLAHLIAQAGRDLRALREDAGMTQVEVAEAIGTNQMQIWNIEKGKKLGMQLRSLHAYAEAIGYKMVISFEPEDEDDDG